jgi:hypothetical protein
MLGRPVSFLSSFYCLKEEEKLPIQGLLLAMGQFSWLLDLRTPLLITSRSEPVFITALLCFDSFKKKKVTIIFAPGQVSIIFYLCNKD